LKYQTATQILFLSGKFAPRNDLSASAKKLTIPEQPNQHRVTTCGLFCQKPKNIPHFPSVAIEKTRKV
jgi:hypothetical protein